jgi:hypothetical protein
VKILLDENLPHDLRYHLPGHEPMTVAYMGWSGVKNGVVLRLAGEAGFDAMITMDDGVAYQQNAATLPIAVIILSAATNDLDNLLPLLPALLSSLSNLTPRVILRIP